MQINGHERVHRVVLLVPADGLAVGTAYCADDCYSSTHAGHLPLTRTHMGVLWCAGLDMLTICVSLNAMDIDE